MNGVLRNRSFGQWQVAPQTQILSVSQCMPVSAHHKLEGRGHSPISALLSLDVGDDDPSKIAQVYCMSLQRRRDTQRATWCLRRAVHGGPGGPGHHRAQGTGHHKLHKCTGLAVVQISCLSPTVSSSSSRIFVFVQQPRTFEHCM